MRQQYRGSHRYCMARVDYANAPSPEKGKTISAAITTKGMARLGHVARQMHGSAQADCANALSCLVNLLLHECCELLFAVHVQFGVDAAGVGSDGVDRHHLAVRDFLSGSAAG